MAEPAGVVVCLSLDLIHGFAGEVHQTLIAFGNYIVQGLFSGMKSFIGICVYILECLYTFNGD